MGATKLTAEESEITILSTKAYMVLPFVIQTRAVLDKAFCKQLSDRLLKTGTAHLEPVLVYDLTEPYTLPTGQLLDAGTLVLADGHHRDASVKALPRGMSGTIRGKIRKGTMEDAILAGLKANQEVVDRKLTP